MKRLMLLLLVCGIGFAEGISQVPQQVRNIGWFYESDNRYPQISIQSDYFPLAVDIYAGLLDDTELFKSYLITSEGGIELNEFELLGTEQLTGYKNPDLSKIQLTEVTDIFLKVSGAGGTTLTQLPAVYPDGGNIHWAFPSVHPQDVYKPQGVIAGYPTSEDLNPLAIRLLGLPPFTVEWFRGDLGNWSAYKYYFPESRWPSTVDDVNPDEHELLQTSNLVDTTTAQLNGFTFDEPTPLWVRMSNAHGTVIQQLRPATRDQEHPVYVGWDNVENPYVGGTILGGIPPRGPDLVCDNFQGAIIAEFYEGESGDTSRLLVSYRVDFVNDSIRLRPDGFVLEDDTTIWARIYHAGGIENSEPVTLTTLAPEALQINDWPLLITGHDAGSYVRLSVDASGGNLHYRWFWGESGDTSIPMEGEFNIPDMNFRRTVVPSETKSFWVEITNGLEVVNSPTAVIIPLEQEAPAILDEPDDQLIPRGFISTVQFELVAVGGDLSFQWYRGTTGDESRPIQWYHTPLSDKNRRVHSFLDNPKIGEYWVKVSNSHGSITSRTATIREAGFEELQILDYSRFPVLLDGDLFRALESISGIKPFWVKASVPIEHLELFKLQGDSWVRVLSGSPSDTYHPLEERYGLQFNRFKLPESGTYRMRVFVDGQYQETGDMVFRNEITDKGEDRLIDFTAPKLQLLRGPGEMTDNGLYTAWVKLEGPHELGQRQVFAGLLGDRSNPIDFIPGWRTYFERWSSEETFSEIFSIQWEPLGISGAWFEVVYDNGDTVRVQLQKAENPSMASRFYRNIEAHINTRIEVPIGSSIIPIPDYSQPSKGLALHEWVDGISGGKVVLPVDLGAFISSGKSMTAIDAGNSASSVPITISVEPEMAPQLLHKPSALAVLPDGYALYSGDLNGDVTESRIYAGQSVDPAKLLFSFSGGLAKNIKVPENEDYLTISYIFETKASTHTFKLSRLPPEFIETIRIGDVFQDTVVSRHLGAFDSLEFYPWIRHSEMGWWYVQSVGEGLAFYGMTADGQYEWNWTSFRVFPYFFNYNRDSWHMYLPNSYGWINNTAEDEWYFVDYR